MNELKLLPPPQQFIVHGVNTNTGIRYAVRPLAAWFVTEYRAVPFVISTNCEIEAAALCNRLNAKSERVYRPLAHPPQTPSTPASAHVAMARERYLEKYPDRLW